MVITLTDVKKTGTKDDVKLYFPVNPEKISYSAEAFYQEYTILNLGAAKIPSGEEITFIKWESFFPGANLKKLPFVKKWQAPKSIHNRLETWRKNGTKLKLNITGSPFSLWVYIDSYEARLEDAYGSIYYTIEFSKVVEVSVEKVKKTTKKKNTTSGNSRTSKKSSVKKHTIKKGDTLWGISKKYYKTGTKWKSIYTANKSTIEKAAKKHGKKSSSNGHWIYPGTVLKIP